MSGYLSAGPNRAIVNIGAVDNENRLASGTFADGSECGNIINTRNHVGAVQVTPAVGEQWVVEKGGDQLWTLITKLPIHTPDLSGDTKPSAGQVQIGSSGPLELFGSTINAHADINATNITIPEGNTLILNGIYMRMHEGVLQVSPDGDTWEPLQPPLPPIPMTTDDLAEGAANLYYTDARASAAAPVQSVAGRAGIVVLTKADVGLSDVSNLTPLDLPLSTAATSALGSKADLVSGTVPDTQLPMLATSKITGLDTQLTGITGSTGLQGIFDIFKGSGGGGLTDITSRIANLNPLTGLLDAAGLTNTSNLPVLNQDRITGLPGIISLVTGGNGIQAILDAFKGAGGGGVTDIVSRIVNLGTGGLFDSAGLTNTSNLPVLNQDRITGLPSIVSLVSGSNGIQAILDAIKGSGGGTSADIVTRLASLLKTGVFNAGSRAGSNLVLSPTFDDSSIVRISYGLPTSPGYSTAQKHSGTQSWTWTAPGDWSGLYLAPNEVNAYVSVTGGEKFSMEAWMFAPTANNHTGSQKIYLGVTFQDSTGVNSDQFSSFEQPLSTFTKNAWVKFIHTTSAVPAGYDRAYFNVQNENVVPTGNVYYIDDVVVREETANQNILDAFKGSGGGLVADITARIQNLASGTGLFNAIGLTNTANLPVLNQDRVTGLPGLFSSFSSQVSTLLSNPSSLLGTLNDDRLPGLGSLLGSIFGGVTRLSQTSRTQTDVFTAMDAQTDTVTSTASMTAQILAALGPGTPDADDFERTGSTLGSAWTVFHSSTGTLGTPNGHDASWGGAADDEWVCFHNTVLAAGDSQTVTMVFSTSPGTTPIFIPTEFAKNDLWARCSNFASFAARTGVRLRYDTSSDTLRLSSYNAGTETLMTQVTSMKRPVGGTIMSLECGVGGNPRRFIARLGGTPFIDWTEGGTASLYGTSYRYRGFGGRQEEIIGVSAYPGRLKQWAATG